MIIMCNISTCIFILNIKNLTDLFNLDRYTKGPQVKNKYLNLKDRLDLGVPIKLPWIDS